MSKKQEFKTEGSDIKELFREAVEKVNSGCREAGERKRKVGISVLGKGNSN